MNATYAIGGQRSLCKLGLQNFHLAGRSIVILLVVVAAEPLLAQRDDPELRERFLNGVADAARKLDDPSFSLGAKCRYISQLVSLSAQWRKRYGASYAQSNLDPMEPVVTEFECALRGKWALQTGSTGPPQNLEYVRARNSSYVFAIQHSPKSNRNALQFVERTGFDPAVDAQISRIESEVRGVALAAYYLWDLPLSDLVQSDSFRIQRVSGIESEARPLVRVEFEHSRMNVKNEPDTTYSDGFLVVDPNNEWVVREYGAAVETHFNDTRSVVRVTLDVGDSVAGMPIATKLERTTSFPDDPGTMMRGLSTVEVVKQEVLDQEFFLSHYGLPEPNFERSWYGAWLLYLIGGAACLAVAYAIRRRWSTA